MCASGYIFQAKVDKIIIDIEVIKTYIDDILFLIKGSFENHIGQLKIVFGRLRAAGLKFNAPKCSFGLKGIPYLGYVTTREGTKLDPSKVQGIMNLERPSTTTEVRVLISICLWVRSPRPHISLIIGWWSSSPRA